MNSGSSAVPSRPLLLVGALALAALGAVGGWWFGSQRLASSPQSRAQIETVVHDYLLEHPEVLPEAVDRLRQKEAQKQIAALAPQLLTPWPGAVLGNPRGSVTLVEFSDFACGYCRHSVADVDVLIAADPDLKVVIREFPILSPQSDDAARMGLAAAEQGRYAAFHHAMYAAGHPDARGIEAAARAAGVDLEKARKRLGDPALEVELEKNRALGQRLGFQGTPSWVVGDALLTGAVGKEALAKAVAEARKS